MKSAKVFMNGRSQAIRLPREFRVEGNEVFLKRVRDGFLVLTRDPWELFYEGIAELSPNAFQTPRTQPPVDQRESMS